MQGHLGQRFITWISYDSHAADHESKKDVNRITAHDPEAHSADVVAGNLRRLKAVFPEAFTEGKIDFAVLKQLLGDEVEEREEKYGLDWHGKRRARQLALTPSTGTLRPCPEENVDWETTRNLMIEGDNLEVLKLLQKSYTGKLIQRVIEHGSDPDSIILDFFAGSGTTGHAVMSHNITRNCSCRYILVQLPEPVSPENKDQRTAADFLAKLGRPLNIAELAKERLRRAEEGIRAECPLPSHASGFRVFKLDTSNIRTWEPDHDDLDGALLDSVDHVKADRSEEDILYELLLKLGLDLCLPIETRIIAGKSVRSVGGGTLITCLDPRITKEEVEPLAVGISDWCGEMEAVSESTIIFRDSAFTDDIAKINLAAALGQRGLGNLRSL